MKYIYFFFGSGCLYFSFLINKIMNKSKQIILLKKDIIILQKIIIDLQHKIIILNNNNNILMNKIRKKINILQDIIDSYKNLNNN